MSKLKVKAGKGELSLSKSSQLVGLKPKEKGKLDTANYVKEEVFKNLGGFKIVTLDQGRNSIDDKLDEVREKEEIEVGTHIYYAEGSTRPMVPTGEIYIIFQNGTNEEEQNLVLDEYALILIERRSENKIIAKVSKSSPNPLKVAHFLQQISLVKHAEPDMDALMEEYDFVQPTDDLLSHQWHLKNEGKVVDVNWSLKRGADAKVINAWQRIGSMGSEQISIAVIDNGFDLTHPDLKDKVFQPYDLFTKTDDIEQGDPRFTHGTPCASVALSASNGSGIVGVAPNAKFTPVSGTSFSLRTTEDMFDYCVRKDIDVVSCSWGTTDSAFTLSPMKEEAIAHAARNGRKGKGCVILFAVGNDDLDFVSFYAAHPDVIAVAACTSKDEHADYSNRGREVSVCAPSNGDWPITAARAWWDEGVSWEVGAFRYWRDGKERGSPGKYKHFGGTSSACPLVAGVCALILSVNPELTAAQVKDILQKTCDKIGHPSEYVNGHSVKYGHGRVNADKAVAEAIRRRDLGNGTEDVVVENTVAKGRGLFQFSVVRQASKGFGVQIGAFAEYGNVLIQAEKLQRIFEEKVIVNINELDGRTVYKIIVGDFEDKADAVRLRRTMKAKSINGFIRNLKDLA